MLSLSKRLRPLTPPGARHMPHRRTFLPDADLMYCSIVTFENAPGTLLWMRSFPSYAIIIRNSYPNLIKPYNPKFPLTKPSENKKVRGMMGSRIFRDLRHQPR